MSIIKIEIYFVTIKGSIIMVYMLIASTYVNSFQIHEVKTNRTKGRNGQVHNHGYIHTLRWKWKHLIFYLIQISLFWSFFFFLYFVAILQPHFLFFSLPRTSEKEFLLSHLQFIYTFFGHIYFLSLFLKKVYLLQVVLPHTHLLFPLPPHPAVEETIVLGSVLTT